VLALLAALATAAPARAATFTVSGVADGAGSCDGTACTTLRAALAAASKAAGPDTISLPDPGRLPYQVTAGPLPVDSEVTITGSSAATVTIQGGGKSRIFNVTTASKVAISHVTVKGGAATSTDDGNGGNILVGQGANLTLDHVRVTGGTALRGGGIAMQPASTLTIAQSLIDHNTATFASGVTSGDAGALLSVGNAKLAGNVLNISDTTIAQNNASQGAGIELTNNAANQTTLNRVTIAFNSGGTNELGNGVSTNDAESIKIGSSIIAGNTGDGVPTNCDHKLTSTGGNIDTATSCGFAAPADKLGTDPQLSTDLGAAGGETPVLSIPATSPAVDFAPACAGEDQRDLTRPQGKNCDSGAFEVDQAPQTSITNGPKPLDNSTTASFTFTSSDPGSTFECNLDGTGFAACSPPQTYTNLSQGAHTLSVRATDPAGNVDPSPATASWTIDSIAPNTTLTPISSPTKDSTPTFAFSSEAGATFECKVDSGAYGNCTSPRTTAALADGSHTFSVRATDAAGNTDGTPATQTFAVDTAAPDTTITPISSPTKDSTPSFSFSSEPGATFECKVDSGAYGNCTSPFTTAALSDGSHTFSVRATDAAGNTDGTPATQTFVVDTAAPDTTITPISTPTRDNTPSFVFSSEPGATFECKVDTGAYGNCTSPRTTAALADGSHTFAVRATDAAGNTDGTPATQTFVVDTVAPDTTLTPIATPTNDATPEFAFTSSEGGSTFKCLVDDGALVTCSSPYTVPTLSDGSHTFSVFATDAAGNADGTAAQQTFTINTQAPTVTFVSAPTGPTNDTTPTLTFASSEQGSSFRCRFDAEDFADCVSPFTPAAPLTEGEHTFDVQAEDAAGNVGSASRLVVIDLTPPPSPTVETGPSGVTTDGSPSFTFAPSTGASAVECSLTGPGQSGAFAPCASPASFSGLGPGDYTFTVLARDAAGNTTTSSRSFTVAVPQQSTPTPTPTPTATPTPPPEPVFHKTVVVQPAGGTVLVRRKGSKTFVPLDATQGIPLGSEVNAKHGKVELSSVPKNGGAPQTALFYGGIFRITQPGRITQLQLSEKLARCAPAKAKAKASVAAAKKKRPKTRSLWGDGHGSFRTKGQYSAATVRGTKWNVRDSCAGTLTRVARGVIAVQDFVRHRTKILRAGQRYLAKPKHRRR
jgi:hypothetical protein